MCSLTASTPQIFCGFPISGKPSLFSLDIPVLTQPLSEHFHGFRFGAPKMCQEETLWNFLALRRRPVEPGEVICTSLAAKIVQAYHLGRRSTVTHHSSLINYEVKTWK
eukprot:s1377_g1.t1